MGARAAHGIANSDGDFSVSMPPAWAKPKTCAPIDQRICSVSGVPEVRTSQPSFVSITVLETK